MSVYFISSIKENSDQWILAYQYICLENENVEKSSAKQLTVRLSILSLLFIFRVKSWPPLNEFFRLAHASTVKSPILLNIRANNTSKFWILYFCKFLVKLSVCVLLYVETLRLCSIYHVKFGVIEHLCYLNGAIALALLSDNISFYDNSYPYSVKKVVPDSKNLLKLTNFSQFVDKSLVFDDQFKDIKPPYLVNSANKNLSRIPEYLSFISGSECTFLFLCHSFTDAQNNFGTDNAFWDIYSWTMFSLNKLSSFNNAKVLIKAHPNFYSSMFASVAKFDKSIFNTIVKKYRDSQNFLFIDYEIDNSTFLNSLTDSFVVLITHHGTAIFDAAKFNIPCIASSVHPLLDPQQYAINVWNSKREYAKLLDSPHKLKYPSCKQLTSAYASYCSNSYSYASNRSLSNCLTNFVGCTRHEFELNPNIANTKLASNVDFINDSVSDKLKYDLRNIYIDRRA